MNPSFTRGEYWLLEVVVEHRHGVWGVATEDVAADLNKFAGHGLSRAMLADTFVGLLDRGLIEFIRRGEAPSVPERNAIVVAMDQGRSLPGNLVYGLTPEGGRQWEAFAYPDWTRFLKGHYPIIDRRCFGEYLCASKERLERYFQLAKEALTYVDEASATWDVVEPWQATYWKTLPIGHRVRFHCDPGTKRFPPDPVHIMDRMERWYAWG
jgi:hypothetical protein